MAQVTSYGNVEGIIKNVLMANGGSQQDPNGRFYIDGQMVGVDLSRAIAEAIYIGELFQNGLNCTAKYTDDTTRNAVVRIPLEQPFAPASRTLSYGGRAGTPGNDGIFNKNNPVLPTTDELLLYLNQIDDQDILFPDVTNALIPLDLMTRRIAGKTKAIAQERSASTLAEVLLYNIYRSLNGASNLVSNFGATQDDAYTDLIADINTIFDNGDPITGAYTYDVDGRCIIGRPAFINGLFKKKSGILLNGNDLAQRMLKEYDLDLNLSERGFVGENYRGEFGRIHFVEAPDQLWHWAERFCGVAEGAFDNILAVAVQADSLAVGRAVDLGVELVRTQSPFPRGVAARPINLWGHEAFRKGVIIAKSNFNNSSLVSLGFSDSDRKHPVSPDFAAENGYKKIQVPVWGKDGQFIGYQEIAEGQVPSGDNWQSSLPQVADVVPSVDPGTYATTQSVALSCATTGADIYYTTDGSEPTIAGGTKYTAAISVSATATIKAIAVKNGYAPSEVLVAAYTISA